MTEEEEKILFIKLGKSLLADQFGSSKISDEEAERAGKSWFFSVKPILKEKICNNEKIQQILLSENANKRNAILISVLEILLTQLFSVIPVLTLANLIIAYGLHKLCQSE